MITHIAVRIKIFAVIILITGCSVTQTKHAGLKLKYEYCAPPVKYNYDSLFIPIPTELVLSLKIAKKYSQHTILTANATGIIPYLEKLDSLEKTATQEDLNDNTIYLALKQKILLRLYLVSSEILSVAAE